jgi:dihydroorotase
VSTGRAVEAIARAIDEGLSISASTTVHHLVLTDQDIDKHTYDPNFRFVPPLRDEPNRRAILAAVRDHDWFSITSDHCPRSLAEKEHEFERAAPGAIGLETTLGATLQALGGDLVTTIKALATRPAAVLGRMAAVRPNAPADLTIFDPSGSYSVSIDGLRSKSHNTPFLGMTLPGRVIGTVCEGRPSASLGSSAES